MTRDEAARMVGASRRRMPRHLFSVPSLLLLMLCCACGFADGGNKLRVNNVTLFVPERTKVPKKLGDTLPTRGVRSFYSPFLAAGSGVMLAIAEARYTDSDDDGVDIVARYIEIEGSNWADKTTKRNGKNWRTQLILQRKAEMYHYALRNPTAVMRGNNIYLLALNDRGPDGSKDGRWYYDLAVGEILSGGANKTIEWNTPESLRSKLTEEVERGELSVIPHGRDSAFLTHKGTIVFSVNARNKEDKMGFAIMQLNVEGDWKMSFVRNLNTCFFCSFLEWKEKLISIFTYCLDGKYYVREYNETKGVWEEYNGTLFRAWDAAQELRDFISVTIENKTVLLFTEGCGNFASGDEQWLTHLWMTDGNHAHDVGVIADHNDYLVSGGLVYTNGELFFLYQKWGRWFETIIFARLNHQLEKIKSVLNAWAENDAYLSKPCSATAPEGASPDTLCVTPMPTDGLVGFLSNKGDNTHWQDEYRFMNARVRNGTKVENGYTFSGAYSGVQWSVGRKDLSKQYNFVKYGLTVVATVTVHETPKGDTPLLTVDGFGVKKRWGLWYKDTQWKVVFKNRFEGPADDWKTSKATRVALILRNNTISANLNGISLGLPLPISAPDEKPFDLGDIFIGGYKHDNGVNMTVTNVLLYNRVLSDAELVTLGNTMATSDVFGDGSVHVPVGAIS